MSLLDEAMQPCIKLNKSTASDGYGGHTSSWVDGDTFYAALVLDTSIEARVAEQQGVTGRYTITTNKDINLQYHDVFKRVCDNKVFRVVSDGDDKCTPASAGLNMRQVSAEEWQLPNG